MATKEITVLLEDTQLKAIRKLRAGNVSQFVQHSVRIALFDAAEWREMLKDALRETGGRLAPNERAWADRILTGKGSRSGVRESDAP